MPRQNLIHFGIALLLVAITTLRLAPTYTTFTATYDEPYHIACGMEWLEKGKYTYELQHPPLARVAVAIGPYLSGLRGHSLANPEKEGNEILYSGGSYSRNLTLARLGNLPFLLLACGVIIVWARRWFTPAAGIWALLLFLSLPPILGHAGLATLDMACAATIAAALFQLIRWLEEPTWRQSLGLAIAVSLAFVVKFSSIGILAVSYAIAFGYCFLLGRERFGVPRKLRLRIGQLGVAACVSVLLVSSAYRFSADPMFSASSIRKPAEKLSQTSPFIANVAYHVLQVPFPVKKMVLGVREVYLHNKDGHDSYLFGKYAKEGWWYFFPVVAAVKTPIGFLLLAIAGILMVLWRLQAPWQQSLTALFPIAIMLFCLTSRINLGIRHLLCIYPLLALVAGYTIDNALRGGRRIYAAIAIFLAGTVVVEAWMAHPDYLAYFNQLAGRHPEKILVESDLDWGQDLHRLSQRLNALGVKQVAVGYFGSAPLDRANLPEYRILKPFEKSTGYVAVSARYVTLDYARDGSYGWLKRYTPLETIGKSIYLYRVDE